MEKGLVILLLCCAGALIADSVPTEEQQRVLELLQQELASAKASLYPVAEKQRVGFPTNPVEQQIRDQQVENAVEQGIRNQQIEEQQILSAKEQRVGFPTNPACGPRNLQSVSRKCSGTGNPQSADRRTANIECKRTKGWLSYKSCRTAN